MNSLRLLIVDDEPLIRAGIRSDLSEVESVQVAGECGSVAEAVEAIRSTQLDLVLLDVQMPDGTGFDVIREVGPQRMPAVVFVTAYDRYALRAFEVNAVDYLLKPFDDVRLRESISRVRRRLAQFVEEGGQRELMEAHRSLLATLDEQADQVRRAATEFETARGVQQNLFPRNASPVREIEYAGRSTPARSVSGDYYDFLPLGGGRLGLVVADVSGKGVAAALLMANLQGCFRTHTQAGPREPVALLRSINALLYESTSPETYATVFYCDYDSMEHCLRYVNCGHPPPFLLRAGSGSIERLRPTATVLGAFPGWEGSEAVVEFTPGDALFAYTDGLTEAQSGEGEEFGDARLGAALAAAQSEAPEAVLDKVMGAVGAFSPGAQRDDITAVVLRRAAESRKA